MALLPNINVGTSPNDGTGDSLRDAFTIVNENFQLIEAFFPNSSVANLVANIESTGTSVFNIANVDVLNVNTISSYTTTNITATNITTTDFTATNITVTDTGTFDTITANSITGSFTIGGNLDVNVTSTGNSSFNVTSYSGNATFDTNVSIGSLLTVDTIDANTANIDTITNETLNSNTITVNSASINGNVVASGSGIFLGGTSGITAVNNPFRANSLFFTNVSTISTDANLDLSLSDYNRVQTVVANLTAGNLTVTLPNASGNLRNGLTYTFICYDEGGLANRTLTVNVQPGAGNIWTSANTQATFVNLSAELNTNSLQMKTNEIFWFTY